MSKGRPEKIQYIVRGEDVIKLLGEGYTLAQIYQCYPDHISKNQIKVALHQARNPEKYGNRIITQIVEPDRTKLP